MARIGEDPPAAGPVVTAFAPGGGFSVQGEIYEGLFLTPERAIAWTPPDAAALTAGDLAPILALDPPPEFVLLGTGARLRFPPRALVQALEARGIGLETMDSRAAARIWGLLRGEERWIVAALMPLG
ncbi:MAG TPA: MTH938/NDUFAF3 family protein [Allosphingosinicella sp.]|nr:MTH938/NDUFAF3 family protein [Allosphingosinicella sp.]